MQLSNKQQNSLDMVLLYVTSETLMALENIFALNVGSSDSNIEIVNAANHENLSRLGSETLYVISSVLMGNIKGHMLIALRSADFIFLSKLMKPVLELLYEDNPDNGETQSNDADDASFDPQMKATLAEMGNILCGVYNRAIYKVCALNSYHSVPEAIMDSEQVLIQKVLSEPKEDDQSLLVIENEFFVEENPIKIWCLISPDRVSFKKMMLKLEMSHETTSSAFSFAQAPQTDN